MGALGQAEIFRWLAAPHSTVIQASDTHSGLCDDPEATLDCAGSGPRAAQRQPHSRPLTKRRVKYVGHASGVTLVLCLC